MYGGEGGRHKVIERNATLKHQVVEQIGRPADVDRARAASGTRGTLESLILYGRHDYTEPRVEEVVTSAGDLDRPLLAELGGAGGTAEDDGYLGEPGGLTGLTDEVGGSLGATVHVLLKLIVRSKVDEAGRKIGCANTRHFFLL